MFRTQSASFLDYSDLIYLKNFLCLKNWKMQFIFKED